MAVSTVAVSLKDDLLREVDKIAQNDAITRSGIISRATKIYVERKKDWEDIFAYGESLSLKYGITEEDVSEEIKNC